MTHNPRHLPMPVRYTQDLFQHQFQLGRCVAYARALRRKMVALAIGHIVTRGSVQPRGEWLKAADAAIAEME